MSKFVRSIREFVVNNYVLPAIKEGKRIIVIRAGEVHKAMGLVNRVPAVINALGSRKFIMFANDVLREKGYCIKLVDRRGPRQSTTTTFIFKVIPLSECKYEDIVSSKEVLSADIKNKPLATNEDVVREIMSDFLKIPLYKERLNIFGKFKEFDLVNVAYRVVGDIKGFTYKGEAAAEFSNIFEYVCLMEKLEQYTGKKWRKIIVGYGRREIFERFKRRYDPWLGDLEIYFVDITGKKKYEIYKIR